MENENYSEPLDTTLPQRGEIDKGKDEMNFAEFPLALISDRVPKGQTEIVFEDLFDDWGTGKTIPRRLTISAPEKVGLPTSRDAEVLMGMQKITYDNNNFSSPQVFFSRYQLIQVLGWRPEGRSYQRIKKSLNRWHAVNLDFKNAWWDKKTGSWVDESFHIINNLTLYNQEKRLTLLRSSEAELPLSSFEWNKVVYRSFEAGYIRSIDLGIWRKLEYAAAKQMYRFLGKRFYHKSRWDFDLFEFAFRHIGFSRTSDVGQVKRGLRPSILELEANGFLEPMDESQRFVKISRGQWKIVFVQRNAPQPKPTPAEGHLAKRLAIMGITPSVATELVREYPAKLIETQIEVLERLQQNKQRDSIRNPAGYLVKSIREGYLPPATLVRPKTKRVSFEVSKATFTSQAEPGQNPIDDYLSSLSCQERTQLEQEALAWVEPTLAAGYHRSKRAGGATFAGYQRMVLERAVKRQQQNLPFATGDEAIAKTTPKD